VVWWWFGGDLVVVWWWFGGGLVVVWWWFGGGLVVVWWSIGSARRSLGRASGRNGLRPELVLSPALRT